MPSTFEVPFLTELWYLGLNSIGVLVVRLAPVPELTVEEDLEEAVVVISCKTGTQLRMILSWNRNLRGEREEGERLLNIISSSTELSNAPDTLISAHTMVTGVILRSTCWGSDFCPPPTIIRKARRSRQRHFQYCWCLLENTPLTSLLSR